MPAARLPTNVLALNGAYKHDPKRAAERADEPILVDVVDLPNLPVPSSLTELEALVWRDLAANMHAGVVGKLDLMPLVIACRLFALALYEPVIDPKVAAQLRPYIAMFGMSPADRSRVKVAPGTKTASPDDEFFPA